MPSQIINFPTPTYLQAYRILLFLASSLSAYDNFLSLVAALRPSMLNTSGHTKNHGSG